MDLGVPALVKGKVFDWICGLRYRLVALGQCVAGRVEHHLLKLLGHPVTPSPVGGRASWLLSIPAGLLFFFGVKLVNSICA